MKTREFNRILKLCTTKKKLDVKKILALTDEIKTSIVTYLLRRRAAIVKEFVPKNYDMSHLHACGYLYECKTPEYSFFHTIENKPC